MAKKISKLQTDRISILDLSFCLRLYGGLVWHWYWPCPCLKFWYFVHLGIFCINFDFLKVLD